MIGSRQLGQLGRVYLSRIQSSFSRTSMTSLLVPPPEVRGQTKLDCEAFSVKLQNVPCLHLPLKCLNKLRGKLKKFTLKLPKFYSVQRLGSADDKALVYLDPSKVEDISGSLREEIDWLNVYGEKELELTYDNWPRNEVLRAILPENVEVPTSYSQIGHIVHVNLRKEQLPYKRVVGQVLVDKVPNCRTVVNKLDVIENSYRNFAMEILAGDAETVVTVKESGCSFSLDFAKVYWNPRLCTEHAALVSLLRSEDVLYDVFAGVGPFSVAAAKKGVRVLGNDLNPESYKWLCRNSETNKVSKLLRAFNQDGRDFLRNEVKRDILERRGKGCPGAEHIAMNLPALALEFLDVFRENWLSEREADELCSRAPTVHVYCFLKAAKDEDWQSLTRELVEKRLASARLEGLEVRHVRNVAPNKEMMRASFPLRREIFRDARFVSEEPANKRPRNREREAAESSRPKDVDVADGEKQEKAGQQERRRSQERV